MKYERLTQLRAERGLTRAELAQKTGIALASLGFYERGEREPGAENIEKMCQALDVSADYLLGLSDTKEAAAPVAGLDPARAEQAARLSSMVYQLAKLDQAAAYDRDCLPVYAEVLEALLSLVRDTDEAYAEIHEQHPAFQLGSLSSEERLAMLASAMIPGGISEASKEIRDAERNFEDRTLTRTDAAGTRIHGLLILQLYNTLRAKNGAPVPPIQRTCNVSSTSKIKITPHDPE